MELNRLGPDGYEQEPEAVPRGANAYFATCLFGRLLTCAKLCDGVVN